MPSPFGELTWAGLDGRGTLADRGILLPGPEGGAAAYVHLAHHQRDEWSAEVAVLPGYEGVVSAIAAAGHRRRRS